MVRRLGIVALLLGAAVGCGQPVGERSADAAPVWVDPACPEDTTPLGIDDERGGIPEDFVTAAVLRCRDEVRDVPGDGSWSVRVTERADTPAAELVEMLRKPSDPLPDDELCPAVAYVPPYFLLVDADGRALVPAVPTSACGQPRPEVEDFLDGLDYRVVAETPVARTQSQESVDTGCTDAWKDGIAIGPPSPGPAAPSGLAGKIRVCVYGAIEGEGTPVGHLEGGHTASETLVDVLDSAGPAAPCDKPHSRFAVLKPETGDAAWAEVELDGCLRVLRSNNTLGQLDQRAIDLLTVPAG